MTVRDLMSHLSDMPQDAEVWVHDGMDPSDLSEAHDVDLRDSRNLFMGKGQKDRKVVCIVC